MLAALSCARGLQVPHAAGFRSRALPVKAPRAAVSNDDFMAWAAAAGVEAPGLAVADCGGYRGVQAKQPLEAGKPLITVPAKLTLVTTTLARQPPAGLAENGWSVAPEAWQSSPWYVRLALLLLQEQSLGAASPKALWLQALPPPAAFADLPMYWPPSHRAALHHPPRTEAPWKHQASSWSHKEASLSHEGVTKQINSHPSVSAVQDPPCPLQRKVGGMADAI